jgi:hypothetical protein
MVILRDRTGGRISDNLPDKRRNRYETESFQVNRLLQATDVSANNNVLMKKLKYSTRKVKYPNALLY